MLADFTKARPGVAFKNGKFYRFEARRIVVVRAWPEPMAWYRTPKRGWRGTRKWADDVLIDCFRNLERVACKPEPLEEFKLLPRMVEELTAEGYTPEMMEDRRVFLWKSYEKAWREQTECVRPFIEQIPADIRTLIAPHRYRAWHLLTLFARCPGAVELYRANPALAFALSGHWLYREHRVSNPLRAARGLVRRKQREILAWMGFPGTKSVQRIFKKIAVAELHPAALRDMKAALRDPERHKVLSHLPVITPEVLSLVNDKADFERLSMRFFMEMLEDVAEAKGIRRILRDTMRMDQQRGGGYVPNSIRSIRRLREVHDDLARPLRGAILARDREFPKPPYAGTAYLLPMTTMHELIREGNEMRHCVASYGDMISEGKYYVYRVLKPVRATLGIVWRRGRWRIDELQGPGNSMLSRHDREAIVDAFYEGTCVRAGRDPEEEEIVQERCEPAPRDETLEPLPWVPCDRGGHPLLMFSESSKAAVATIRSIFASVSAA